MVQEYECKIMSSEKEQYAFELLHSELSTTVFVGTFAVAGHSSQSCLCCIYRVE